MTTPSPSAIEAAIEAGEPVPREVLAALASAERVFDREAVDAALDRMAAELGPALAGRNPLVLVVMNGGMIPAAELLKRMPFPLQVGYLHLSRYRGATRGGRLDWIVRPAVEVRGRSVLVIDDIFDEGHTLKAIAGELRSRGAREVVIAVLVDKRHGRKVPGLVADCVGLTVGDRYVFGCGMDYREYGRNLPEIYALAAAT